MPSCNKVLCGAWCTISVTHMRFVVCGTHAIVICDTRAIFSLVVQSHREIELNGLVNLDLLRLSIRENARSIEDAGGGAVVRRLRWGESSDVDALCESLPPTDIGSTWVVGSEVCECPP